MISINITPPQLAHAFADLDNYSAKVQARVRKESVRAAYAIDSKAKANAPVDNGHLRQSIHVETQIGVLQVSIPSNGAVVGTNKEYAAAQEFGSKPHVILPKSKKMLRWWAGGVFVFARKVNHPGNRAVLYLTRASDSEKSNYIRNIVSILIGATK